MAGGGTSAATVPAGFAAVGAGGGAGTVVAAMGGAVAAAGVGTGEWLAATGVDATGVDAKGAGSSRDHGANHARPAATSANPPIATSRITDPLPRRESPGPSAAPGCASSPGTALRSRARSASAFFSALAIACTCLSFLSITW